MDTCHIYCPHQSICKNLWEKKFAKILQWVIITRDWLVGQSNNMQCSLAFSPPMCKDWICWLCYGSLPSLIMGLIVSWRSYQWVPPYNLWTVLMSGLFFWIWSEWPGAQVNCQMWPGWVQGPGVNAENANIKPLRLLQRMWWPKWVRAKKQSEIITRGHVSKRGGWCKDWICWLCYGGNPLYVICCNHVMSSLHMCAQTCWSTIYSIYQWV